MATTQVNLIRAVGASTDGKKCSLRSLCCLRQETLSLKFMRDPKEIS